MRTASLVRFCVMAATLAAIGRAQSAPKESLDEISIRALIQRFADARNAHDGDAVAAIYSEDGEWMASIETKPVKGRPALAALWGNLAGQVQRTIRSIEFPGNRIAVVRVATHYSQPPGDHSETFILVKDEGKWSIRVHQSID
jgi:uncharacterized protein (TIGR02246 family)